MNLKVAAERLGVHYQTAYRWVRSGELTAMRVGTRYDVSEAAIARFTAGRRAVLYVPEPARDGRRATDLTFDDLLEELEAMATDPIVTVPAAANFTARRGAEVLGDMCFVVKMDDEDDERLEYSAVDHPRADQAEFLAAAIGATEGHPTVRSGMTFEVLQRAQPLRVSHFPQDRLRASIRPELRQHASHYAIHSLLAAPILGSAGPTGILGFTRDTATHAYTATEEEFAVQMATRIGWLFETAREIELAWRIRADLADACRALISRRAQGDPPTTAELDQLFRDHPESSDLPVVVLDTDFRCLTANETFVRSSGHSLHALVGNSFESFTHPDDRDSEKANLERLVSGELDFLDIHARRVLADGTHREYASHRAAVRDPDATLRYVLAVARPMHHAEYHDTRPSGTVAWPNGRVRQ
jgi:PAS domain S-box-containing protein/excisionase family DNA binding protein